jgi:hypothetical protein
MSWSCTSRDKYRPIRTTSFSAEVFRRPRRLRAPSSTIAAQPRQPLRATGSHGLRQGADAQALSFDRRAAVRLSLHRVVRRQLDLRVIRWVFLRRAMDRDNVARDDDCVFCVESNGHDAGPGTQRGRVFWDEDDQPESCDRALRGAARSSRTAHVYLRPRHAVGRHSPVYQWNLRLVRDSLRHSGPLRLRRRSAACYGFLDLERDKTLNRQVG